MTNNQFTYDMWYMYDILTDMYVHKAYMCDYSTQQKPGVNACRRAGCITQSAWGSLKQKNQTMEMQAIIMQLGFMIRWEIKKSGHNLRDIFFAGSTAQIYFQSDRLFSSSVNPEQLK